MTRHEIVTRLKAGEKLDARINCYGKVYKRRLKIKNVSTFIDGVILYCKLPRLKGFMVSIDEIISLHRVAEKKF